MLRVSGKGKREVFRYVEELIHNQQRSPNPRRLRSLELEKEMQLEKVKQY
ncbi:MAG: hypothetical protein UX17_C0030G0015 [Parcubacteria group bacterium GW2011_GWC2_45_7]|nr:MAG: hypothetical protein UX17_C0030G0015 [Parcubacteria group bacterium GW2011_GWC2_45_7]